MQDGLKGSMVKEKIDLYTYLELILSKTFGWHPLTIYK